MASTTLVTATISVTTEVVVVAKAHVPRVVIVSPGMGPLVPSVVAPPQNIQLFILEKTKYEKLLTTKVWLKTQGWVGLSFLMFS